MADPIKKFTKRLQMERQAAEEQIERSLQQTLKLMDTLSVSSDDIEASVDAQESEDDVGTVEESMEASEEAIEDVPSLLNELKCERESWRKGFIAPLSRHVLKRKEHKSLSVALDRYSDKREQLVRRLPAQWQGSGAAFCEAFGELPKNLSKKARWKKERKLCLSQSMERYLTESANRRFFLEDGLVSGLSRLLIFSSRSWAQFTSGKTLHPDLKEKKEEALQDLQRYVALWKEHCEEEESNLARALLKPIANSVASKLGEHRLFRSLCFRSLESDVKLQDTVENLWNASLTDLERIHRSLEHEYEQLEKERAILLEFLSQECDDPESIPNFPGRKTFVVPTSSRMDKFSKNLARRAESLPTSMGMLNFKVSRKITKTNMRKIDVELAFDKAALGNEKRLRQGLDERTKIHLRRQKELDQAREVVLFAAETAMEDPGGSLVSDAVKNAINLLKSEPLDKAPGFAVEKVFQTYQKSLYPEFRERLGRDRIGLVKFLLSNRGGVKKTAEELALVAQGKAEEFSVWLEEKGYQVMEQVGWLGQESAAAPMRTKRVVIPALESASDLEIPKIYQRLFEIEPLTDPRFLIGRDEELESFREAREFWKSGKSASILLSGHRGSGKSSLLNCVETDVFSKDNLVRFEVSERITDVDALHQFIANALELESTDNLSEQIDERGGVIMLEEVERLFLRKIGGFQALDGLLEIIAQTQERCLWVLAINETALRLLQRVRFLSGRFSHRIRASGVSPDSLQKVIMLRHDLSGLRLKFDEPEPAGDSSPNFLARWLDKSPERTFFRKLSQHSRGVFRTALELWLGHIRVIEGGCLFMSVFRNLDTDPLMEELGQSDFFTLTAILQHGGLTAEQLAEVFSCSVASKQTQLDELMARELLEKELHRPGMRVRSEAMPVLKEALFRKNLL